MPVTSKNVSSPYYTYDGSITATVLHLIRTQTYHLLKEAPHQATHHCLPISKSMKGLAVHSHHKQLLVSLRSRACRWRRRRSLYHYLKQTGNSLGVTEPCCSPASLKDTKLSTLEKYGSISHLHAFHISILTASTIAHMDQNSQQIPREKAQGKFSQEHLRAVL